MTIKKVLRATPIFIIILGTIFTTVAMIRTGLTYSWGIGFWGPLARDGVWHEALVGQIAHNIPPINPGFAGLALTNYHYFYDAFIYFLSQASFLPVRQVIYILFPVGLSMILGQVTYFLSYSLFRNRLAANLSLFFLYFGSSFGWVLSLLRGQEIGGESAFWANQPVSINLNPPFALSLLMIVGILLLVSSYTKNHSKKVAVLLIALSGIIVGVKVYAGVIVLAGLLGVSVVRYLRNREKDMVWIFTGSAVLAVSVFFLISREAGGLISIQPLWLIDTMIDAGDRVGIPNFTARRFAYIGGHRWIQYAFFEALAIIIFIAGNLGTRIVGLLGGRREFIKNSQHVFILFACIAAFLPPFIFVQKGNPWNTIQFFYYFLFFAGLYTANTLAVMWQKTSKIYVKAIVIVVLIITPISSIATFRSWLYPRSPAYLSVKEGEALAFLAKEPYGAVLTHPFEGSLRAKFADPYPILVYADSAYVAAFTGKPVYLEDAEQQIILDADYATRGRELDRFFTDTDLVWSNDFLATSGVTYLYLPKIYYLPAAEVEYSMRKIFENSEVNIYKVIN